MMVEAAHFILYVADQERSRAFYSAVLAIEPSLHVPGMTEFRLGRGCVLGLMPLEGARRLLGPAVLPDEGRGASASAELYLYVDDPAAYHARALAHGSRELSGPAPRSWGDVAAYSLELDGYVLAFGGRPGAG